VEILCSSAFCIAHNAACRLWQRQRSYEQYHLEHVNNGEGVPHGYYWNDPEYQQQ